MMKKFLVKLWWYFGEKLGIVDGLAKEKAELKQLYEDAELLVKLSTELDLELTKKIWMLNDFNKVFEYINKNLKSLEKLKLDHQSNFDGTKYINEGHCARKRLRNFLGDKNNG